MCATENISKMSHLTKLLHLSAMENHVYLIIEGTTEKMLQYTQPLKSIYNKNLGFIEQKCIFENQTIKNL
jgi:hypothetical protein